MELLRVEQSSYNNNTKVNRRMVSRQQHLAFGWSCSSTRQRSGVVCITHEAVDSTLRIVFWQGMSHEKGKNAVRHKMDQANRFDEVMQLIRVTEQELVESQRFHHGGPQPKPRTAHAAQTQKGQDKEKTADSDL